MMAVVWIWLVLYAIYLWRFELVTVRVRCGAAAVCGHGVGSERGGWKLEARIRYHFGDETVHNLRPFQQFWRGLHASSDHRGRYANGAWDWVGCLLDFRSESNRFW